MSDDESNKITLAVLSQQLLTLTQEMAAMRSEMRQLSNTIIDYRVLQSRNDTQILNLGQDYDALSARINGWSSINSAGVIAAAILALFFGNKQP